MKTNIILSLIVCGTFLTCHSMAEQTGSGHYVSGTFLDFSGTVPTKPGWAFGNFFMDYDNGTFSGSQGLPYGDEVALDVTANMSAEVPLAMYTYPMDFLGGNLASAVAVPFVWLNVKANVTIGPHTGKQEQSTSGLGDIQLMPIMAGWTNGDCKFDFIMNIYAPTGDYDKTQLANTGLGYWTFTPMVAFSWLSHKIGTEFTIFTGLDFNTENTDANYQSGDIFHVDSTLAQHLPLLGGIAGAGATAFYLKQITGDSGSGAKLGGFEAESYGVGPTISYIHKVGSHDLVFDASWLPQLHAENTTKGNFFWAKLSLAF
jgi:hypothetical protein